MATKINKQSAAKERWWLGPDGRYYRDIGTSGKKVKKILLANGYDILVDILKIGENEASRSK